MNELVSLKPKLSLVTRVRGGLAAWQQRVVTDYVEEHLAEQIPLATLAGLARLSPYHFSRAFKQSFGVPIGAHQLLDEHGAQCLKICPMRRKRILDQSLQLLHGAPQFGILEEYARCEEPIRGSLR